MVFLVKRQSGVAANVELVDGAGAFAGDEEADDFGDFLRLDQLGRIDVRTHLPHHLGGHGAGADEVNSDAEGLNLLGEYLSESCERVLGR